MIFLSEGDLVELLVHSLEHFFSLSLSLSSVLPFLPSLPLSSFLPPFFPFHFLYRGCQPFKSAHPHQNSPVQAETKGGFGKASASLPVRTLT